VVANGDLSTGLFFAWRRADLSGFCQSSGISVEPSPTKRINGIGQYQNRKEATMMIENAHVKSAVQNIELNDFIAHSADPFQLQ
jgi:hypothetical protein